MPQVRVEKNKNELASLSLLEVCQLVTAPHILSFLSLVYCPDLQQQKEAHCAEVASPQEGTLPLFAPLKILETPALLPLEILSLGEPLLHMGGATCFRCWDSTHTHTKNGGARGERAQSIQSMVSISLCPQHLYFFWNLLQLDFTIQAHSSLLLICFHLKL